MTHFFTLLYIKTNRFSDEKFCVGVLANLDGIPYFGFSISKLNMALQFVPKDMSKSIKRSFNLLEFDVNKIVKGEEALSLFDLPYVKKILDKLTLKKRGVITYSELHELSKPTDFSNLYKKFVGMEWELVNKSSKKEELTFKKRFYDFTKTKKYNNFQRKFKLKPVDFPIVYVPLVVDLIKRDSYYLVFQTIDFSKSMSTIQSTLNKFRLVRQSLMQKSDQDGLSKGRYYLVYEPQKDVEKRNLIERIKTNTQGFELLRLSEIGDKV